MSTVPEAFGESLVQLDPTLEDADGWVMVGPGVWSPGPRATAAFLEYQKANSERLRNELLELKVHVENVRTPTEK